jgi:hypothetical protein
MNVLITKIEGLKLSPTCKKKKKDEKLQVSISNPTLYKII